MTENRIFISSVIFRIEICEGYGVKHHLQQYFSYIVAVRLLVEETRSEYLEKTTDHDHDGH
jgi:hypothetical protein